MAGDSPGRAEQQESSGETTGKVTDPRNAVRREAESALAVAVADDPAPHRAADEGDAREDEREGAQGSRPGKDSSAGVPRDGVSADAKAEAVNGGRDADGSAGDAAGGSGGGSGDGSGDGEADGSAAGVTAGPASGADGSAGDAADASGASDDASGDADAADASDAEESDAASEGTPEGGAVAPEGAQNAAGVPEDASGDQDAAEGASGPRTAAEGAGAETAGSSEGADGSEAAGSSEGAGGSEPEDAEPEDAAPGASGKPAGRAGRVEPEDAAAAEDAEPAAGSSRAAGTPEAAEPEDAEPSGATAAKPSAGAKPAPLAKPAEPEGAKPNGATAAEPSAGAKPAPLAKPAEPEDASADSAPSASGASADSAPSAGGASPADSAPSADGASPGRAATALMPAAVPPPPAPAPPLPGGVPADGPAPEFGSGRPTRREQTRQQPLPPAPEEPLKLLAALTNTPAPPQTLLRTSLRRVKIWTPLVLLLVIVFCIVQAVRPLPAPALTLTLNPTYGFGGSAPAVPWPSEGQAAMEVEGLGSMGTYGAQKPEPIASVAKIMTAYIVLHDHPMKQGSTGASLTVDQQAAADFKLGADGESVVKVTAGARISQFEALEDIMIASANNIARMLSRWDAGSEAVFVKKMNATAKSLGMDHTTYTDPSGLTATTVSTAGDQLKLVEKAMADPVFRQVVAEPSYRTASGDTYNNWNHLVGTNDVVGVKTGTSTAAGGNLVFAAYKDVGGTTQLILGVVLGQYKPSILDTVTAASLKLVLAAQHELTSAQVIGKGSVVGYVDNGFGGHTPVVATRTVRAVGWPGVKVPVALKAGTVPHTAKAGADVGTLTVGDGPGQIRIPVTLRNGMTAPGFGDKLTRLG
ncbi:D-alanyl-D-alanine carboxypeptidase [Streptantibioticus silvisoli]|uniref:D-alanyl-D-alanine carboxypeptidase n=1 Tax=Streptantibioticus silvisoli TaxID=2705255 RepID=A0ABT6WA12_9ACTN|nr:D-alanyl-D-alanine carboxypeptidase [Streptantibioticus silvisoli]MDI5967345.1 D-alanyl-D-alanine carboxypeptidase [Streptantibioticus silvisoli]